MPERSEYILGRFLAIDRFCRYQGRLTIGIGAIKPLEDEARNRIWGRLAV